MTYNEELNKETFINDAIVIIKTSAGYIRTFRYDPSIGGLTAQFTDNPHLAKQLWSEEDVTEATSLFAGSSVSRMNL